jgi:CheY-like chemotaxis protein
MADILVVDDDPIVLAMVGELLRDAGHEVRTARDGQAGLAQAQKKAPHLVILDLNMPRMDGFALAKALRKADATSRVPLIALTSDATLEADRKAYDAGCNGFLAKPLDATRLYEMVELMFEYRG